MATDTPSPALDKSPITASTNLTLKLKVGSVATVGVRVDGATKPVIQPPDGPRLFVARDGGGAWVGSWVPMTPGEHQVIATIPDADPVVFTITATDPEA